MPDLFITYSRKNKEFVRRLVDEMEKQGRDVWVDWEDIPPTVDWMQEIRVGIDGSDNYVFVITPDSLNSKVCLTEIEHALQQEKKLIPVLHQDVEMSSGKERRGSEGVDNPLDRAYSALGFESDSERMLEYLSPHNWIFFREEDDFETAFATLSAALDDDQSYKNEHTRLLVRAREWDSKGREHSFLLTDAAIDEAEQWLQDGESKSPKPTDLHRAYINASRLIDLQESQYEMELQRAAARRLRYLVAALTVFLLAAIVLSLFAFSEQGRAKNAQSTSESSRSTSDASLSTSDASRATTDASLSTTDASLSTSDASRATTDASLSTSDASRATTDASLSTTEASLSTSDANRQIAQAAQAIALRRAIEAESFVLAERARLALENGDSRTSIRLALEAVNLDDPPPPAQTILSRAAYVGPRRNYAAHRRDVVQAAISPDGTHVLSASDDGSAILWDIASGEVLKVNLIGGGGVSSVAFRDDGKRMLASSVFGTVTEWDVEDSDETLRFATDVDETFRIAYNANESEILVAGCIFPQDRNQDCVLNISRWDVDSGEKVEDFDFFYPGAEIIEFSPDGRWVAIASEEGSEVFVADVRTADTNAQITTVRSNTAIAFDQSGQQLALASGDGSISIFNVFSGNQVARFQTATFDRVDSIAFSQDNMRVAVGLENGAIQLYDLDSNDLIFDINRHSAGVSDLAFVNEDQQVLTASFDSTMLLWDLQHGAVVTDFGADADDEIEGVAVRADGGQVFAFTTDYEIVSYDVASGAELQRLPLSDDPDLDFLGRRNILTVVFTPSYDAVLALKDDITPHLIDMETGEEISELVGHEDTVTSAVFSPDGEIIYTGGFDGQVIVWEAATGEQIGSFEVEGVENPPFIISMDISADGLTLVAGTLDEDSIAVWNTETGEFIRAFSTQQRVPDTITLSPDGSKVAAAGGGSTITLWDIETGTQILRFEGHAGDITNILFNADGSKLISGSDDQSIIVWDITTGTPLRSLEDHTSAVTDVVFGPDELTIYSASWTDGIIQWRLDDTDALIAWTCENRAVIDLTEAERAAYGVTSTTPLCELMGVE